MVTFGQGTGTGELESFLFIAPASDGYIGKGAYENAHGPGIDSGVLTFGTQGGC